VIPPAVRGAVANVTTVAVFDGGVHDRDRSGLFPISVVDVTPEAPDADDLDHGTGVTGAVMYGLLQAGAQAPQPPLPVESFRVTPPPYDQCPGKVVF
jgi:hypothetical protein